MEDEEIKNGAEIVIDDDDESAMGDEVRTYITHLPHPLAPNPCAMLTMSAVQRRHL